ncbi:AraC family transcriptional regulator [Chromatiales bacterium (ex Bugula neritina AB1)]|nr:AraC family transcriptional regulator [Chromatiales bacterium (ex Bugula neritina AB1)]
MDLLSSILNMMKMSGTLYFRTSFTSPWGVEVPPHENVSRFHYVHRGRCFARLETQENPVALEQGDLIIITHGERHWLSEPHNSTVSSLETIVEDAGFNGRGALIVGDPENGHETQLICGHFAFDPGAQHVLFESLPQFIHVKDYGKASPDWLDNSLKMIGAELGHEKLGGDLIALRLSEIIYTQAIRHYLENDGKSLPGLAGFSDSNIRAALIAMHDNPANSWSVEDLAKISGMSRTAFSNRFNELIGNSPLNYLINWRMQIARQLLIDTDSSIIDIALKSGYQSEAAFGRIFKRYFNVPPAGFRRNFTGP